MSRPVIAPGTHGTISTTRLESDRFRAVARYRRWDGDRRVVTATGRSEAAASRLLAERISQLLQVERALEFVRADSPFGDVAEAWLVELRTGGTPEDAVADLEYMLRHWVLTTFEQIPIDEITAETLGPFLVRALSISAERGRFSRGILNMVMDFACRNGIASANPLLAASKNGEPVPY